MAQRPDHAQILLALTFGQPGDLAELDAADWQRIDALAADHKLRPWLAHRWGDDASAIPPAILTTWQDARRLAAFEALHQRGDLRAIAALLEGAGVAYAALKGPWFAWYGYPAPELRPMNDLDVLVAPEHAERGYALLQNAGYTRVRPFEAGLAQTLAAAKHLPQLASPSGTVVELHVRCWPLDGPTPRDAGLLARAHIRAADDPVRYPAAPDLFAHLAVHAAVEGRFDCGALAALDLAALVERETLDWPALLAEARSGGWLRHAALLLAVTDRLARPGLLAESGCDYPVPQAVIDTAARLMVQDLGTCREAQFFADVGASLSAGHLWRSAAHKLRRRPAISGPDSDAVESEGYRAWLADRIRRMTAAALSQAVRRQAADYRRVLAWCSEDAERR